MSPTPVCPLTSGIIEDEIVVLKSEQVVFLLKRGIYMSMQDFKECDLANGVILRIGTADEKPTDDQPTIPKPKKVVPVEPLDLPKPRPFNDSDYEKPEYNLTLDNSLFITAKTEPIQDVPKTEYDLPIEGMVATVAMALALIQQVKQKKNEAESKKCCTESKFKFSEYDSKIEKLNLKIDEKTKQETKTLQAEMYEQYKELKDLRSDAEELKGVVSNLLTYMTKQKSKDA